MSNSRYNSKSSSKSDKYWYPILLVLTGVWIFVASQRGKSPTEVITDSYNWVICAEDANLSRKQLKKVIYKQEMNVDSLQGVIDEMLAASPYRNAKVNTTANALNLRIDPNLSAEVVIRIPDSSIVKVLYFDEETLVLEGQTGKWCKIQYADKEGWVWGNYIEILD
ncbi:MAG: SH3 domain-containing protein [Saprospiraceae bacterium]